MFTGCRTIWVVEFPFEDDVPCAGLKRDEGGGITLGSDTCNVCCGGPRGIGMWV